MTLIMDAGGLIAVERRSRDALRLITRAPGTPWLTHGGVVGQVWRDPRRQVALGKLLGATEIRPMDAALGRDAGLLLARSGTSDVIDAALVLLACDGDVIVTSDPDDIAHLAEVARLAVDIVVV
ncbi:MAG: hypothetical protein JHD16_10050 [Solirubrobacteraceae bacterium]|nr:hypothetical protein [Solirubrobacteraceae bacterium]